MNKNNEISKHFVLYNSKNVYYIINNLIGLILQNLFNLFYFFTLYYTFII